MKPHRRERHTSRVLLVDEEDHLLLLCGRDPRSPGARWWFTVGGGVEEGEDYVQAALRELREETGLSLPPARLGNLAWTRQTLFSVDGNYYDQYEEYRLARVTTLEAATLVIDPEEARYGHRWWPLPDIATTNETIRPTKLATHLPPLLAGRTKPLHLGNFNEDHDHPATVGPA